MATYQKQEQCGRNHWYGEGITMFQVLHEPQPHFDLIKECYPHVLHGRSKNDELVFYEKPGCFNVKKLVENQIKPKQMGRHYTFINEVLYSRLLKGDEDQIMSVMDVGEFSMRIINSNAVGFLKVTDEIMQSHYPERVARIVVINCPFWLPRAWKTVGPLLAKNTRDKVCFANRSQSLELLQKYIEYDQIPSDYGGSGTHLGGSEEEEYVIELVKHLNNGTFSAYDKENYQSQDPENIQPYSSHSDHLHSTPAPNKRSKKARIVSAAKHLKKKALCCRANKASRKHDSTSFGNQNYESSQNQELLV